MFATAHYTDFCLIFYDNRNTKNALRTRSFLSSWAEYGLMPKTKKVEFDKKGFDETQWNKYFCLYQQDYIRNRL
jgi:hypothetical protein